MRFGEIIAMPLGVRAAALRRLDRDVPRASGVGGGDVSRAEHRYNKNLAWWLFSGRLVNKTGTVCIVR
jgi:hypothetical protein